MASPFARRRSAVNLVLLYNLIVGAEERSRTADTRIFSPLLYHLSYLGIRDIVGFPPFQCQASVLVIA
jgi:hypothetical protein